MLNKKNDNSITFLFYLLFGKRICNLINNNGSADGVEFTEGFV